MTSPMRMTKRLNRSPRSNPRSRPDPPSATSMTVPTRVPRVRGVARPVSTLLTLQDDAQRREEVVRAEAGTRGQQPHGAEQISGNRKGMAEMADVKEPQTAKSRSTAASPGASRRGSSATSCSPTWSAPALQLPGELPAAPLDRDISVVVPEGDGSGVIIAQGGAFAGWSLYLHVCHECGSEVGV